MSARSAENDVDACACQPCAFCTRDAQSECSDRACHDLCWCGMTAEDHLPHQSRCPRTPTQVREWVRMIVRVIPPASTGGDQ